MKYHSPRPPFVSPYLILAPSFPLLAGVGGQDLSLITHNGEVMEGGVGVVDMDLCLVLDPSICQETQSMCNYHRWLSLQKKTQQC